MSNRPGRIHVPGALGKERGAPRAARSRPGLLEQDDPGLDLVGTGREPREVNPGRTFPIVVVAAVPHHHAFVRGADVEGAARRAGEVVDDDGLRRGGAGDDARQASSTGIRAG